MNKAISRTNKLIKTIGYKNFFTNRIINNNLIISNGQKLIQIPVVNNSEKNILKATKKNFFDDDIDSLNQEKGSRTLGRGQKSKNLKLTFQNEKLLSFFDYIEKNHEDFNDSDFSDSFILVGQKMELDTFNFTPGVYKRNAFKILNDYIKQNFEKILSHNFSSLNLLHYIASLANTGNKILSNEQSKELVQKNLEHLQQNHSSMQITSVLQKISLLGCLSNYNFTTSEFLTGRENELEEVNVNFLMRTIKRATNNNFSNNARSLLVNFLSNVLMEKMQNERVIIRIRLLNYFCKMDFIDYNLNLSPNIRQIVKILKQEFDSMDIYCLNFFAESLTFWEQNERNRILREVCDNFIIAINNRDPGLNKLSVNKFIGNIAAVKQENIITNEHLMVLLDYYLEDGSTANRNINEFVKIYSLFKRMKFHYANYLEKCFDIIFSNMNYLPLDEHFLNFRFIVKNHMRKEYNEKIQNYLEENSPKKLQEENQGKLSNYNINVNANNFLKMSIFGCNEELVNENFEHYERLLKSYRNLTIKFLYDYISIHQFYLTNNQRDIAVSEILKKIKITGALVNYKTWLALNELMIPKNNEELKAKYKELDQNITNNPAFKKKLINFFVNESSLNSFNKTFLISNISFSRFLNHIRQGLSDEEFSKNLRKIDVINLLKILTNLVKASKTGLMKRPLNDDYVYLTFKIIGDLLKEKPDLMPVMNTSTLANYIRILNMYGYESNLLEKLSIESLKNLKTFNYNNSDQMKLLERILISYSSNPNNNITSNKFSEDKIILIKKFLGDEENFKNLINNKIFIMDRILKICAKINSMDKNLLSDGNLKILKDEVFNKIEDDNINNSNKINLITALSNLNNRILRENDFNKYKDKVHNVLKELGLKFLVSHFNEISNNIGKGSFSKFLYNEIEVLYEGQKANKTIVYKILDKYSLIKYPSKIIFNKIINDYGEVANNFNETERASLIIFMERINFKHTEIIEDLLQKIKNIKYLNDEIRFNFSMALIKFGYHLEKEGKAKDFLKFFVEEGNILKFVKKNYKREYNLQTINNLIMLNKEFDVKEIINQGIEKLNSISFERKINNRIYYNGSLNYAILASEFSEKLNENFKNFLTQTYESRISMQKNRFYSKLMRNALDNMKINFTVGENLFDLYLPEENTGIIFVERSGINMMDDSIKYEVINLKENLEKKGFKCIIISSPTILNKQNELNNIEKFIEFIETEYKLPNKNTEKIYEAPVIDERDKIKENENEIENEEENINNEEENNNNNEEENKQ